MRIKSGDESAYAEFAAEQSRSPNGQAVLDFMNSWSGMMEYAIDRGVRNVSDIASVTLAAAAETSGVTEDDMVVEGGQNLLKFWEHGEGLNEWLEYHPPKMLGSPPAVSTVVWDASQDLLDVLSDLVERYPEILHSAPDILDIQQARMAEDMSFPCPMMAM